MTNSQGSGPTRMMNDDYKAKGSQPEIDPISEGFGMDGWMAGWMDGWEEAKGQERNNILSPRIPTCGAIIIILLF